MFSEFLLFIKYPYTAGIIGIIWLGTAALLAIDHSLPVVLIMIINMCVSILIASFGFRGKGEL